MMHFMRLAFLALLLTAPTMSVIAQDSTPSAGPDSITDQIMKRRRHLEEYLKLMKDPNPATRSAAIQQALKDSDPVVRGGAISAYLKRFNALTPEVSMDKITSIPPQELPRLAIENITWSDDGVSARGYVGSCGNSDVRLQIAGGKVAVAYGSVCLRPSLIGIDTGGDAAKSRREVPTACQLTLSINSDGTSLDGPLHCVGLETPLPVQLPFGA